MNICISCNIVLERKDVSADNIFWVVSKFTSSKTIYCINIYEMSNFLIKGVVAIIWELAKCVDACLHEGIYPIC